MLFQESRTQSLPHRPKWQHEGAEDEQVLFLLPLPLSGCVLRRHGATLLLVGGAHDGERREGLGNISLRFLSQSWRKFRSDQGNQGPPRPWLHHHHQSSWTGFTRVGTLSPSVTVHAGMWS